MPKLEGRAAWPSLFVFCAALLLLAASLLEGSVYRWAAITLLLLGYLVAPTQALPANGLSLAVGFYCAWLFANAAFVTPTYSAETLYRPLILFGGFAAAAVLGREARVGLFRIGVTLVALLVLIGLLQFFFGFWHLDHNPQRAAATFITPNTFATAINLLLLPMAAVTLTGRGGWQGFAMVLWLFAGLLATESRGGWLGFVAGAVFIAAYLGLARAREARGHGLQMLAGLAGVAAVFWVATLVAPVPTLSDAFGTTLVSRGSSFRTDIYAVALELITERPLAGHGANMFRPLYEMRKPLEMDIGSTFLFVHNDYLQVWLEFGLAGLILLGVVIATALWLIAKALRADRRDPVPLACGAAAAGIFSHALVDFPLYIPFLLLVIGLWLGALAAESGDAGRLRPHFARAGDRLRLLCTPLITAVLAVAALAWLAQPVFADLAGRRAVSQLTAGKVDAALYWQSVARRLEPRNAGHYWAEGVIWRDQAVEAHDKALAEKADMLFAEGIRADPYQVANYLERARLHRKNADLFNPSLGPKEVLGWSGEALRLRPYSLVAQAEHARALAYAGRTEEARRMVRAMIERHPGTEMTHGLAIEFGVEPRPGKTQ